MSTARLGWQIATPAAANRLGAPTRGPKSGSVGFGTARGTVRCICRHACGRGDDRQRGQLLLRALHGNCSPGTHRPSAHPPHRPPIDGKPSASTAPLADKFFYSRRFRSETDRRVRFKRIGPKTGIAPAVSNTPCQTVLMKYRKRKGRCRARGLGTGQTKTPAHPRIWTVPSAPVSEEAPESASASTVSQSRGSCQGGSEIHIHIHLHQSQSQSQDGAGPS